MDKRLIYHFTHIDNLAGIISRGLLADNYINHGNYINSGNQEIKDNRKKKQIFSGKCVGDYVPFYFAPRSPMMYRQLNNNKIKNETTIYLVANARYLSSKYEWCCSDINAAIFHASFFNTWEELLKNIDWNLMRSKYWKNTEEYPDRKERRMAEFLVYKQVDFIDFLGIAVYNDDIRDKILACFGSKIKYIDSRPQWYF